jgi:undecaprenyl-diphosphatase
MAMLRALPQAFSARPGPDARRVQLVVVGTVPIVIVGLLGGTVIEETLRTPAVAAASLALGALFLLAAERLGSKRRAESTLTFADALVIGAAQSAALVPGVSRSGATIGTGLLLGFERRDIARFTFLMSVPAILAAAAKEGLALRHLALSRSDIEVFAIGTVTSAVVGYIAVKYLLQYLATHRLDVFAWYRLALAAVLVAWLFTH